MFAEVKSFQPLPTKSGRKSRSRFAPVIEVREVTTKEIRDAVFRHKNAATRPLFRILHGYKHLAVAACLLVALLTATPAHAKRNSSYGKHRNGARGHYIR